MPRSRKDPPDLLAKVTEAARRGSGRRQLSQWFWDNYEVIAGARTGSRMSWVAITNELMKAGYRDSDGKPLKRENVRKAFNRAGSAKMAYLAAQPPGAPELVAAVVATVPTVQTVQTVQTPTVPAPRPPRILVMPRDRGFKPSQRKDTPDADDE